MRLGGYGGAFCALVLELERQRQALKEAENRGGGRVSELPEAGVFSYFELGECALHGSLAGDIYYVWHGRALHN